MLIVYFCCCEMGTPNDINVNLADIIAELQKLAHTTAEEVLLVIITAIILLIILVQRIYHCYALVCKNNNNSSNNTMMNSIAEQELIPDKQ